jgi:predicted secreted protein
MNTKFFATLGSAAAAILMLGNVAFATADIVVTEADGGKIVKLSLQDCLSVKLQTQAASTGYDWYMTADSTSLMKLDGRTVTTPGTAEGAPVVGAPAMDDFSLCAIGSGSGKVKFDYRRPWERGAKPAKHYEVNVQVGK